MAGDDARDRVLAFIRAGDAHADDILDATQNHCRRGVWSISICADLTPTRLLAFQAHGKCASCSPATRPAPDLFERTLLVCFCALVEVEHPASTVIPPRRRCTESGQRDVQARRARCRQPLHRRSATKSAPSQIPWVERPPGTPLIRRQGQMASQLHDSRYVPATRQSTSGGELDDALRALVPVTLAERFGEPALELTARGQLLDDVRAADELAPSGRSAGSSASRRGPRAPGGKRGSGRMSIAVTGAPAARRALSARWGVAARREARRPLHEDGHGLGVDELGWIWLRRSEVMGFLSSGCEARGWSRRRVARRARGRRVVLLDEGTVPRSGRSRRSPGSGRRRPSGRGRRARSASGNACCRSSCRGRWPPLGIVAPATRCAVTILAPNLVTHACVFRRYARIGEEARVHLGETRVHLCRLRAGAELLQAPVAAVRSRSALDWQTGVVPSREGGHHRAVPKSGAQCRLDRGAHCSRRLREPKRCEQPCRP